MKSPPSLTLRKAQLEDLPELQQLYLDTITEVCKADYSPNQIDAWTSATRNQKNQERWNKLIAEQYVLVAQASEKIIGFISLDRGTYIDFLYVHKEHQRQGVAHQLYAAIEAEAMRLEQRVLTSDVSKTARPFFEKKGFKVIQEQSVKRNGVVLTNYAMRKALSSH